MDYESMWNELKTKIEEELMYHLNGIMQSIGESLYGASTCKEVLSYMKEIEERYT